MYVRYVVHEIDPASEKRLGVFQAAFNLQGTGQLLDEDAAAVQATREWFNENLERPTRFTNAKKPYHRRQQRCISWFRAEAREHIEKVQVFIKVLRKNGIEVTELNATRVGYVVYEDEHQITAEPFADTNC
jgi:hypothetical protein